MAKMRQECWQAKAPAPPRRAGMDGYLSKPIVTADLREAIESVVPVA